MGLPPMGSPVPGTRRTTRLPRFPKPRPSRSRRQFPVTRVAPYVPFGRAPPTRAIGGASHAKAVGSYPAVTLMMAGTYWAVVERE